MGTFFVVAVVLFVFYICGHFMEYGWLPTLSLKIDPQLANLADGIGILKATCPGHR